LRAHHRTAALAGMVVTVLALCGSLAAQAPFLSYDFEDGSLADFFNANGPTAINFCADGPIPSGLTTVDAGELLFTNDELLGICSLSLFPDVVQSKFPANGRDYTVKMAASLESVNELLIYVRSRIGIDEDAGTVDSQLERGYAVVLVPAGSDQLYANGALSIAEFTACHTLVPHPEWPGAAGLGFAHMDPGFAIDAGDWYEVEASPQGDDDGGPVRITARLKLAGGGPAAPEAQLSVIDANGLDHTPETLSPAADVQLSFGTSYDFNQQPLATCRVDDISFTQLQGCDQAPFGATRTLWGETVLAEGVPVALYEAGGTYAVSIALSDLRAAGTCAAPLSATVTETLPAGWTASDVSHGGSAAGNVITWNLDLTGGLPAGPLQYTAKATGSGLVTIQGELGEAGSTFRFPVTGPEAAASQEALPPVSDFGSIQHWLILGPFTREAPGANPGEDQIVRDYLTDGSTTEADIRPKAGDTIEPDYSGTAASTGLAPNLLGRNPGDVPTWVEWRDYDDADDRIDFETVYGDLSDIMCYAVTYLNVSDDVFVNFGVSSDDSVVVMLDGEVIHKNNVPRGALGRSYQDTPAVFPTLGNVELTAGQHILLVKVFEGGGEHNFRVGFLDETGFEIPGGPDEVTISLVPDEGPKEPAFRRGDADATGRLDISDGIFTLNFLFTGGRTPPCFDSADADDNGKVEITDAIRVLGFLFIGGAEPPPPGPASCGADPTPDSLSDCVYDPPAAGGC